MRAQELLDATVPAVALPEALRTAGSKAIVVLPAPDKPVQPSPLVSSRRGKGVL